jgi:hypothetical protein
MAHSFITTNVGFSSEYKRYLFGYPVKHDKVNEPDLLDFSLASGGDPAFVKLSRGCYVKLTTDTYGLWFSGYITNEPELEFLGAHPTTGAAVYGYNYQATSDDYILNLQPVGLLPAYINTTVGGIIRDLVERLAPGVFTTTDVDNGQIIAYYPIDPNKKFGEIVKELADNTFYRFWAKDHILHFKKMDTLTTGIIINGNDAHFTPSRLQIRQDNAPIVNDVTVLGQVEPQDYMNEYFIGDGYTGRFPLLAGVYGAAKMTLLDEVFSGNDIDEGKWVVEDPGGLVLVADNGYLNALGGTGDISDTYLMSVNPVPLEGTLRLTHGEWDFVSSSTGVVAGLWTQPPNAANTGCVYAIKINGTTLNPIVNGTVDGTKTFTVDTTKRYIIRTIAAFEEVYRYSDAYNYINQAGTIGSYGGTALADKVVYTTTITEIEPTDGTITTSTTWTNSTTIADTKLSAFYVPMACGDLHATVTAITLGVPILATLEHKNEGEVDWTLDSLGANDLDAQDGNSPVATIVVTGGGNQIRTTSNSIKYNPADAELQYFKDSIRQLSNVPAESALVHIRYRRAGAAIGRVKNDASIAAEAAVWGDNGRRSLVRKDLNPAPRTSQECEFAAAAILQDAIYQHYEGNYEQPHPFSFTSEPLAGTILHFSNLPDYSGLQAETIKEVTTVFRNASPSELFMHTVQFGREDYADKLLSGIGNPRGATIPQDAAEIPDYIDTASVGTAFAPNITGAKFTGYTTTTWNWDTGQVAPAGGGIEVRYTNASWGTDDSKNLITRLTGATTAFTTPRTSRGKVCWLRAYDSSGNYSRYSAGLRVTLPLIPEPPTGTAQYDETTGYPSIDITLPALLADVWGVEIRAGEGNAISGEAGPWIYTTGINSAYNYGTTTFGDPPPSVTHIVPATLVEGDLVTITYISGTVSTDGVNPFFGPMGDPDYSGGPAFGDKYPAYYMEGGSSLGECALCGAFTDNSGLVILPFIIGYGRTIQCPPGATKLQLGVNEDILNNDEGSFNVTVAVNGVTVVGATDGDDATVLSQVALVDPEWDNHWVHKVATRPNGFYYLYSYNLLGEYSVAAAVDATPVMPTVSGLYVDDNTKILNWDGQGWRYRVEVSSDALYTEPNTWEKETRDKFLQLLDPDFFPLRYIKVTAFDKIGDGGFQEITHDYAVDPPVIVPQPVSLTITGTVVLNGWTTDHVGDYEDGGGAYAHSHPPEIGAGGDGTTLAYTSASSVFDSNDTTAASKVVQHSHAYAGCVWGFTSPATSIDGLQLRVLSEVTATILTGRNASIWYTTSGASSATNGALWTLLYETPNDQRRSKQWDTVTLPNGTNPNNVRVMAFLDSHDNMGHYVYSIQLIPPGGGTGEQ